MKYILFFFQFYYSIFLPGNMQISGSRSLKETSNFGGGMQMLLRKYKTSDCKTLSKLFFDTVHTVNARDYTREQLNAWATGNIDFEKWDRSFREHYTIVAVNNEIITGFGDMDKTGYLDMLFIHKDYQGKGIATAICNELEQTVKGKIVTYASVTARPFFEKRGYIVIRKQQAERQGIFLTNFVMEKQQ